jgi:large subunit ribosomal protein L6
VSRIGKKPITLVEKLEIQQDGQEVRVKGPKGELAMVIDTPNVKLQITDGVATLVRSSEDKTTKSLHGLYRATLFNLIQGVLSGFQKDLELQGVGYRVQLKGTNLEFSLGFSHPVVFSAPDGIQFKTEGTNKISVIGIDKHLVGQVAAKLRELRSPDPYKGKGVRYVGEYIRKKQGKSVKK